MVGQDIIHEAMRATWTIDKVGGVLAIAIILVILLLISGMILGHQEVSDWLSGDE